MTDTNKVDVEPVAWTTKGQIAAMENGFQHYIQGRVPRFVQPTDDDVALYHASALASLQAENERLRWALKQIEKGHHDPTPTRRIYLDGDAARCDEWWMNYYASNDKQNKQIARAALGVKI